MRRRAFNFGGELIDRKFILAGRIAVVGGGAVLTAMLVSAIQFDPSVMALAVTAVLGGIVAAGSNRSTAKEAVLELTTAEAKRNALIEQIDLRLVPDREGSAMKGSFELQDDASGHFIARSRLLSAMLNVRFEE